MIHYRRFCGQYQVSRIHVVD